MNGVPGAKARIVVVGNEKGGSGKSTTAMHLIAALMQAGHRVAAIDLDVRQGTLTRYLANRRRTMEAIGTRLAMPAFCDLVAEVGDDEAEERLQVAFDEALRGFAQANDYVVIDTPGSAGRLSRYGHSFADILLTPLNDSFVDLDLLANVDPNNLRVIAPSRYAEMVWEQKKARAIRDRGSIEWVVMRNRLGTLDSRNKVAMERVLAALARRIGFRLAPGFSERVIFRELFLKGLTLLDLRKDGAGLRLNMSHVAARQEVRMLVEALALGNVAAQASGTERVADPI